MTMSWSEETRVKRDRLKWTARMLEHLAAEQGGGVEKIYDHTRVLWDVPVHAKDSVHESNGAPGYMLVVLRDAASVGPFVQLFASYAERQRLAQEFVSSAEVAMACPDPRAHPTGHFYVREGKAAANPRAHAKKREKKEVQRRKARERANLALFEAEHGSSAFDALRSQADSSGAGLALAVSAVEESERQEEEKQELLRIAAERAEAEAELARVALLDDGLGDWADVGEAGDWGEGDGGVGETW
jgi:hypothetical protein